LPKPRNAWLPAVFIATALAIVAGTVLSANGGRNMLELAKRFGMPLPQHGLVPVPGMPFVANGASASAWPWLFSVGGVLPRQPTLSPSAMCETLSSAGQEPPFFQRRGESGWECSVLLSDRPDDPLSGSLFLQARGETRGFSILRVKFNLADGRLPENAARHAVDFIRAVTALPADKDLDANLMSRLAKLEDFYFIAGYHGFSFRRELDDASRYNLIAFNRYPTGAEFPVYWPSPDGLVAADISSRLSKGPRITALISAHD
jgi:hypothetical protein